uniref:Uncharacterized protein n=1 Tax=Octopus bimaculoides TaxID=37653 RepID=A0A0L8FJY9_OCTBM
MDDRQKSIGDNVHWTLKTGGHTENKTVEGNSKVQRCEGRNWCCKVLYNT